MLPFLKFAYGIGMAILSCHSDAVRESFNKTETIMKVILLPFGSYLVGESRDQDFVAFHFDQTLVELLDDSTKCVEVEAEHWNTTSVSMGAKKAGFPDPDIWMSDQVGDMKPIIVANLVKDYPRAAGYVQMVMGCCVTLQGGDTVLKEALDANVRRWCEGIPHLPNLRKRAFSRIQRDAYVQGLGFFNTKSEIAQAAEALQLANFSDALAFLTGHDAPGWNEPDPIYKMIGVLTYQSEHGCILSIPDLEERDAWRMYLTPIESRDGRVCVFWEEIYTYKSSSGVIEIEKETWSMLLSIDLKEVQ